MTKGKVWRQKQAKHSDLPRQLVPKGEVGVCLGQSDPYNTTTSLFILCNGNFVDRNEYVRCENVIPEGWELNEHGLNTEFGRQRTTPVESNDSDPPVEPPVAVIPMSTNKFNPSWLNGSSTEDDVDQATPRVPSGDLTAAVKEIPLVDRTDLLASYYRDNPNSVPYVVDAPVDANPDPAFTEEDPSPQLTERELRAEARLLARNNRVSLVAGLGLTGVSIATFEALFAEDTAYALYAWATVCLHHPMAFLGLSSFINEPLKHHKKDIQHFSYKKALTLNRVLAVQAKDREKDKMFKYGCFTDRYEGIPNFADGSSLKFYPLMPFKYKTDAVTGEKTDMSGRLAIDGSSEKDVPNEEKSTHTADQELVNLTKAAFVADITQRGLIGLLTCNDFDVDGAFLHVDYKSDVDIYVQFPLDFPIEEFAGKLMLMLKAVYGVKRSNAMFNVVIDSCLTEANFVALGIDRSIYVCYDADGKPRSILLIHVDDGQMFTIFPDDWSRVVAVLERRFGPLKKRIPSKGHVGVNTNLFPDGSFNTDQKGYILKSLQVVDPENKLIAVPTPSLKDLFVNDENSPRINVKFYQHLIGLLIYALHTRLDIKKEVLYMAKRSSCPTEHDLVKVTRIFAYLKGTPGYGPTFHSTEGPVIYAYTDAAQNAHKLVSRAQDGNFVCVGIQGGPSMARSKMQSECIATSATESEYVALTYAAKSVVRARLLMEQLGYPQLLPTIIYSDCKSAVTMANTVDVNKKSQHINVKFNYIKDLQHQKIC